MGNVEKIRPPDVIWQFHIHGDAGVTNLLTGTWATSETTSARIAALSWQKDITNWFHRHFCHAAVVIGDSFLARSPLSMGAYWTSALAIAGGYRSALDEVWRGLMPGGLFFVNPWLYYSAYGSHLGEFSDEPHLHLKITEDELHDMVMNTSPGIIDRASFDVSNADYWRFYKDLNRTR
ncbi:MAG: hypothetical protein ACLQHK_06535 [Gallionellaceae bacterium]